MLLRMRLLILPVVFLGLLRVAASTRKGSDSRSVTTPHPEGNKLEQLKMMEESSLTGWYGMVNQFLKIIRPDQRTLDYVINFFSEKHNLNPQETVLKIAEMNYMFLTMVIIGLIYVIVMLLSGVIFLFCRCCCGRCGAKDSQRLRRNDNCWRTIHKFCLVLMVAFLVVPIACMYIINEHMKHSTPNVKGNITEVFDILIRFSDKTDKDVEKVSEHALQNPIQNFDEFKSSFVESIHENITNSIDQKQIEEMKSIVTWVLNAREKFEEIINGSGLTVSVKSLKDKISEIRQQLVNLQNCTNSDKKMCQLDFRELPLERIDVEKAYAELQAQFKKIMNNSDLEEVKQVLNNVQNSTVVKDKIDKESESLKRFIGSNSTVDKKGVEKIKKAVKEYTDQVRQFANAGKQEAKKVFAETDGYEVYRWWSMFGAAIVLLVPVLFLCLGLMCGCCGYEKERHPTKRSSSSNFGGNCLILAVYYFFLVSSVLMVVTIGLFVFGGNAHTFVCIPLFQKDFVILDDMTKKFMEMSENTKLKQITPSKLLNECADDKSIVFALGLVNESDPSSYEQLLKQSGVVDPKNSFQIDEKLKVALGNITAGIHGKLQEFIKAFDRLKELQTMPVELHKLLRASRHNISVFAVNVTEALKEDLHEIDEKNLGFVNESANALIAGIDEIDFSLSNYSAGLNNILREAQSHKENMIKVENSLVKLEESLPGAVKAHLFLAVATSSGWQNQVQNIGKCYPVWVAFDMSRIAVCDFIVNPINGFWFALGWALIFIIPTIFFAIKLSRFYLRMKYDDDSYMADLGEAIPLEDSMGRAKPFSYTGPGAGNWMPQFNPHQNYAVHPSASHTRHFHYK